MEGEPPVLQERLWRGNGTSSAKVRVQQVRVFPQNKSSRPKAMPSSKPRLFSTMWKSGRFSCLREHAHYSKNFQGCCIRCQDIIHLSKQSPVSDISWFSTQNIKWGQDSREKLMYNPGIIVCWRPALKSGANRVYWYRGWNESISPPFNHSPQCQQSLSSAWHELKP